MIFESQNPKSLSSCQVAPLIFTYNGELSRAGAGCRLTESDGEAPRGSNGLLGGAFFMFLFIAPPTRRWRSSSPLSGA